MKAMIDGEWRTDLVPTPEFQEAAERLSFRGRVTADGGPGFKAEAGRYHLYVSYACPFAHRTLLARRLLGWVRSSRPRSSIPTGAARRAGCSTTGRWRRPIT